MYITYLHNICIAFLYIRPRILPFFLAYNCAVPRHIVSQLPLPQNCGLIWFMKIVRLTYLNMELHKQPASNSNTHIILDGVISTVWAVARSIGSFVHQRNANALTRLCWIEEPSEGDVKVSKSGERCQTLWFVLRLKSHLT